MQSNPDTGSSKPRPTPFAVLPLIRPLALLAVGAMVIDRGLAPALLGATVGIERWVTLAERSGAVLSQLLSIAATVVALSLLTAVTKTASSRFFKGLALIAVIPGALFCLSAASTRGASPSALAGASSAALLSLAAAWQSRNSPSVRSVGSALYWAGLAGSLRMGAFGFMHVAVTRSSQPIARLSGLTLTASFGLEVIALLLVALHLFRQNTRGRMVVAISVGLAILATRAALHGGHEDAGIVSAILRRVATRLTSSPASLAPLPAQWLVACWAPILATAAALSSREIPAVAGTLAIIALCRAGGDMPMCALLLMVACLTTTLVATNARAVWG